MARGHGLSESFKIRYAYIGGKQSRLLEFRISMALRKAPKGKFTGIDYPEECWKMYKNPIICTKEYRN
ncbi:MAG: hypothetical protein ACPK85_08680 [Methanosarcina sp.]